MTAAGEARESLSVLGAGWKEARHSCSSLLSSALACSPVLSSPSTLCLQPVTREEPKKERHDVKPSRRTSTSAARNRAERSNREPRFCAAGCRVFLVSFVRVFFFLLSFFLSARFSARCGAEARRASGDGQVQLDDPLHGTRSSRKLVSSYGKL